MKEDKSINWKTKFGNQLLEIPLSDSSRVKLMEKGILYEKDSQTGVSTRVVYQGRFQPIRKLRIDEEVLYEVHTNINILGNLNKIQETMKSQGGVLCKNSLSDCINGIVSGADLKEEMGHAAYGVYEENGRLTLCVGPYPLSSEQERIVEQVNDAVEETLSKEKIQNYISVIRNWDFYEVCICMSYGIMAMFASILKEKKIMIAYPFHSSPEHGLGKSLIALIFSQRLFGIVSESMGAVCTSFRLTDALDSFCGLKCIDESDKYAWDGELGNHIKQSAESRFQGKRGNPDKTSRIYHARLVPCFTGNSFNIKGRSNLVRFFRVEFNIAKKQQRSRQDISLKLWTEVDSLRPIGFKLVESELKSINYSLDDLCNRIREYGKQIADEYGEFCDSRRAPAWGVVYEGLKAWERICDDNLVEWKAPPIKDFVRDVVRKVEAFTFETKLIPLEDFLEWFMDYRVLDVSSNGVSKTENIQWKTYSLKTLGKNEIDGYVVTAPIIKRYNRDNPEGAITNLGDLARCVVQKTGLNIEAIYETRRFKIGEMTRKGVFIPDSLFDDIGKEGNSGTKEDFIEGKKVPMKKRR
jgi:hypothetical protein